MNRLTLLTLLSLGFFATGCEEQGPLEQAGEEIDEAVEDAQVEGETLGNQADDIADELRDAAQNVGE